MRNFLLLFAIVALSGCYTEKRAAKDVVRAHVEYPTLTASYCNQWYPIRWHDSTYVEYINGEVDYIHDTVIIDCDTVKITIDGTKVVKVPCPPCPYSVDTIKYYTKKIGESTAALEVERAKTAEKQKEIEALKEVISDKDKKIAKLNVYLLITGVLSAYCVVRWVIRFWGVKLP